MLAYPPRRWGDLVVATVRAARVEQALRRGGIDQAARIGRVRVVMDGKAAPTAALDDAGLTPREREKLDTAWRLLRQSPFNSTCLRRAIVGGSFLARRAPILRVGVAKRDGIVTAHAWIEVNGVGLDPDGANRYAVLTAPMEGAS